MDWFVNQHCQHVTQDDPTARITRVFSGKWVASCGSHKTRDLFEGVFDSLALAKDALETRLSKVTN